MRAFHGPKRLSCNGPGRREWLQIGGLGAFGLSLANALFARVQAAPPENAAMFGRAKNVILLFLTGGPPQHETFDPKPQAPSEIRGPFRPIQTNVPGIHVCELLPRIAAQADKLAIVRSMYTDNNIHGGSGYWVLTGRRLITGDGENARPSDWPAMASVVKMLRPSPAFPALTSVTLPEIFIGNGGNVEAGQFAGFLGEAWNPEFLVCNPADPQLGFAKVYASLVPSVRLAERQTLLERVEQRIDGTERGSAAAQFNDLQRQAFALLSSRAARRALAIEEEPDCVRERYGLHHWGQSVLLARRLIEAGVRFVTVNWPREPGDRGTANPLWDTHTHNFDRMEDVLAPQFDVGLSALLDDLADRGLLTETLVVAVGEFGRTPQINRDAGRDHWGNVFSCVLAGAGIAGGQVFGASDKSGAFPAADPVNAGHLAATIFHLVGINHQSAFADREGRTHLVSDAEPLYRLLGCEPANTARMRPTGEIDRVPPYSDRPLLQTDFGASVKLTAADEPPTPKGWRGYPLFEPGRRSSYGVAIRDNCAILGVAGRSSSTLEIPDQAQIILAQEIRNPRTGRFVATVEVQGVASSPHFYEHCFLRQFRSRLVFFRYTQPTKRPRDREELASIEFRADFREGGSNAFERFRLERIFGNAQFGMNFSFGLGLGVAVIVDRISSVELPAAEPAGNRHAMIRVRRMTVEFEPRIT